MSFETLSGAQLAAATAQKRGWKNVGGYAWIIPDPSVPYLLAKRAHTDKESKEPPPYHKDMNLAWECVEEMRLANWLVVVKEMPEGFPWRGEDEHEKVFRQNYVTLQWMPLKTDADMRKYIHSHYDAFGVTAAEALCRLYLEWVEKERDRQEPHVPYIQEKN